MKYILYIIIAVTLAFTSSNIFAAGTVISKIRIEGNKRVETTTIELYLDVSVGDKFDDEKINSSLKKMYNTELFSDVSVSQEGSVLVIKVAENPIINKVVFEGNKRISDEILSSEISLESRSAYTKAKVQNDTQKIQDIYSKSGRFSVEVDPKIVTLDQNRVDLIFEIKEGKKTTVGKINFIGNKIYDDSTLATEINTRESRWYSFYSGNDTYDSDKVAYDKELLRKFYVSKGYADFNVISTTAEITKDKKSFILTFTVSEGDKYKFGEMEVYSSLPKLKVDELNNSIKTTKGDTFNAELVDKTIEDMTNLLNDLGYAFVDINSVYNSDTENDIIGIKYEISEGPKVYINRININGNTRTRDKVIRREFRFSEGDPFNAAKIRRSKERIQNLGFFDKVDISREKASEDDKADINLELTEKSTGELSVGAGFSTHDGALANINLQERNLLGKGQTLRMSLQQAETGLTAELGFTEPYFLDKDLSAGFDIWNVSSERADDAVSSTDSTGLTLRGSYSLTEHLRHTLKYIIKEDSVTNITENASIIVQNQAGATISSIIGQTLLYDKRDNRFNPRNGYFIMFDQKLSGLGGDVNYIRHETKAGYYVPIYKDDFIFKLLGGGGHILGYGDKDIRYADNFRLTGRTVRGFESIGFGPTDFSESTEGTILGGKRYYSGTIELAFPLAFMPKELGFTGFAFNDFGSITGVDSLNSVEIVDPDTLHASAGLGFSWVSPLGPLNVSYAIPYLKDSYDTTQKLQFDFGTRF